MREMFSRDVRYPAYSATKSVTSTAVGLAVSEGKMDISRPLAECLDETLVNAMPAELRNGFSKLSIERFLTMSVTGYPFRPEGEDWLREVLAMHPDTESGPSFSYTNVSAYLVGAACENAVGMPIPEYLQPRIFEPLDMPLPEFQYDPQGRFNGATGMKLTVHELSLIGQLYLQEGEWNGTQLVPKEWTKLAVLKHIDNDRGGYGYFFWCGNDSFSISGKWGQRCIVYPKKGVMITYMGNIPDGAEKIQLIAEEFCEGL
ncbi:CubicO group peptidase, beta-lactamase class C family [Ruminococcus sp. XPD3002]|nr:CubicO group peptidase, beta-lactamase class C family [Ruminococcus flavefaciens]